MNKTSNRFSSEVRDHAVSVVGEHRADHAEEWAALASIAGKIGCTTDTLSSWCLEGTSQQNAPAAQASDEKARLKLLEREVRGQRRANESLREASAYFARALLDCPGKW
jgi:transposase